MYNYYYKKILCNNIVNKQICKYYDKCIFAHNIEEQNKNSIRQYIYDMINNFDDLSSINIYKNKNLFDELKILCNYCEKCVLNKCSGGYNCKYGAFNKSFKICYNDMYYGTCKNDINDNVCVDGYHFTKKMLIPYNLRLSPFNNKINNITYINKYSIFMIKLNNDTINIINKYLLN